MPMLRSHGPQYVLILAGDHVYRQDYSRMLAEHIAKGADITVSCVEVPIAEAREFGVVGVDETDRIVSFLEKPKDPPPIPERPDRAFASMGIYVFNAELLYDVLQRDAEDKQSMHDFGKNVLPSLASSHRLLAHRLRNSTSCRPRTTAWRSPTGATSARWTPTGKPTWT